MLRAALRQLALGRLARPAAALLDEVLAEPGAPAEGGVLALGAGTDRVLRPHQPNLVAAATGEDTRGCGEDEFTVVVALELLAVSPDPQAALRGVARLARRHLVVAAPRVPLGWMSGYPSAWTSPSLLRLLSPHGAIREVWHPAPWTLVWVRRH